MLKKEEKVIIFEGGNHGQNEVKETIIDINDENIQKIQLCQLTWDSFFDIYKKFTLSYLEHIFLLCYNCNRNYILF